MGINPCLERSTKSKSNNKEGVKGLQKIEECFGNIVDIIKKFKCKSLNLPEHRELHIDESLNPSRDEVLKLISSLEKFTIIEIESIYGIKNEMIKCLKETIDMKETINRIEALIGSDIFDKIIG